MAIAGRSYPNRVIFVRPAGVDDSTDAALTVTAAITADGIVGGPSPAYVLNNAAIQAARQQLYISGFPNRPSYTWRSSTADAPGQGSASLAVTASTTAAGTAGEDAVLAVTASITAGGIVGLGPSPTYVVNQAALWAAFYTATAGFPNRPAISTGSMQPAAGTGQASLAVTDTITAAGAAGGDAALAVTASITAAGTVVVAPSAAAVYVPNTAVQLSALFVRTVGWGLPLPAVFSRSSAADAPGTGLAALNVTAAISAAGAAGGSAALAVTASITADGIVGLGPSPTYVVNITAVRDASLLYRTRGFPNRPTISRSSLADLPGQGSASFVVTASIAAAGQVATSSGASLTITATITATGQTATSASATLGITATITTAGTATAAGALPITVTITAAGTVATSTGTTLAETVTLVAAGSANLAKAAALAAAATITAAGAINFTAAVPPITVTGGTAPSINVSGAIEGTSATGTTGGTSSTITVR